MTSKRIIVRAGAAAYPVVIGAGLEKELLQEVGKIECSRIALITDSTVKKLWGMQILRTLKKSGRKVELFSFPAGERNKTQASVTKLQHELLKRRYGRDTLIVALGGGVVGDLAGFVAATYMRGIPYIQMPTTLLAMVDSSVGGKVGVDTPFGKNTVGAFWRPQAVIADIALLENLPRREFVNGLFEAIKTFYTSDANIIAKVSKLDLDAPLATADALQNIINRSVAIKAGIVSRDERESGERMVVNFGHTIGHAVELLSGFKIPHGFAVAYGMLVESKIAELLGILPAREYEILHAHLESLGVRGSALKRFSISRVLQVAKTDKKSKGGVPRYVLLSKIGAVHVEKGRYAHSVKDAVVMKAFQQTTQ